jgi:hypothetical protein
MSERELGALEAAVNRGEKLTERDIQEVMAEQHRLGDENTAQIAIAKDAVRIEAGRLGRSLTSDEEKALAATPAIREAWDRVGKNNKRWSRLVAVWDDRAGVKPRAATASGSRGTTSGPAVKGNGGRAAFSGLLLLIIIIIAAVSSGGSSNQVGPGNSSGSDISIKGCDISTNPDGSVHARATISNGGTSSEQANVVITMHWYGGATDDDNGLLGNGYSVPAGTQYVAHDFTVSAGKSPIYCDAKLQY